MVWGPTEEKIQDLKQECLKEPVLKMYDPRLPIRIETDSTDLATGACLSQKHEDKWHPVAYLSMKLSPAEQLRHS